MTDFFSRIFWTLSIALFLIVGCKPTEQPAPQPDYFVFVGTYTKGNSEGIYVYRLNMETGSLTYVNKATGIRNPSFLALDSSYSYLYAVGETDEFNGQMGGSVHAYRIDHATGALTALNSQPSGGVAPCYISLDHSGKWLMTANYGGGNLMIYPIGADGNIGSPADTAQHAGQGPNPDRQQAPHAHSILTDPTNSRVFAADLGIDQLVVYQLDQAKGQLQPDSSLFIRAEPGAGPRHFEFHPNGQLLFVINELNSSISSYRYDPNTGTTSLVETVSTLPADFTENNTCADIHLSPDGKFVYGSNRGHNSIVAFTVDATTGKMTYVSHTPTQGETPRNFGMDPTGKYLLVANQNTENVLVLQRDSNTGMLTPVGQPVNIPMPVCLKFMPVPAQPN